MKQSRETKQEVDLTTLLDPEQLRSENPDDCFGVEWDPQDTDCSVCHDVEICGILKQKELHGRKKKIEKEKGPFLDQTSFESVPIEKIVQNLIQYAEDDDPATYEELEETIGTSARTKDIVAIREYIKTMLPRHGLRVTEEKTVIPYEKSDNHLISESPLTTENSFPSTEVSE